MVLGQLVREYFLFVEIKCQTEVVKSRKLRKVQMAIVKSKCQTQVVEPKKTPESPGACCKKQVSGRGC